MIYFVLGTNTRLDSGIRVERATGAGPVPDLPKNTNRVAHASPKKAVKSDASLIPSSRAEALDVNCRCSRLYRLNITGVISGCTQSPSLAASSQKRCMARPAAT